MTDSIYDIIKHEYGSRLIKKYGGGVSTKLDKSMLSVFDAKDLLYQVLMELEIEEVKKKY